ncbi:MAG: hypothetical protein A2341_17430 [Deltaproteobacteria bacterium RIFOXYB12_FULL_58_9]|nr:MAG: hypothetical protein A2341_17430 [Deltaproteobacteria bacterium RIFOXYB12_FULL_58_9]
MKDHLIQVVSAARLDDRRNVAREYLQLYVLRLLHELGLSTKWAFCGGTALRVLYALPRFSEDLDFSVVHSDEDRDTTIGGEVPALKRELERAGYRVNFKVKEANSVHSAMIRFEGILADCQIVPDPRLALSIKVEIDTKPPPGFHITTTLIQRYFPIALVHHELPSLFAGKLHAILTRGHVKGRDWYDLVWYLTEQRGIEPNVIFLRNALRQTGGNESFAENWRGAAAARCRDLDWNAVRRDVSPFLVRQNDLDQMNPELVLELIRSSATGPSRAGQV